VLPRALATAVTLGMALAAAVGGAPNPQPGAEASAEPGTGAESEPGSGSSPSGPSPGPSAGPSAGQGAGPNPDPNPDPDPAPSAAPSADPSPGADPGPGAAPGAAPEPTSDATPDATSDATSDAAPGATPDTAPDTTADPNAAAQPAPATDTPHAGAITVYAASRRAERIVEAPAAVTAISEREIAREITTGQLPKLLDFTPGAEVTQSGLYDFNLNTRGFNSSLNRRVPTLIDGRDPSIPFLMSQDWPSLAALEDLASVELVRGPSAALYGANAFNGVLNLTTREPRRSLGGTLRLTGGELATRRADLRFAHRLGGDRYLKLTGARARSEDFYQSRCTPGVGSCPADAPAAEYPGLLPERVPLADDEDTLGLGSLRFDQHLFDGAHRLTVEGGYSSVAGPVTQTGGGRIQVLASDRSWGRLQYNAPHFDVLAWTNTHDAPRQLGLLTGANFVTESTVRAVEVRGDTSFAAGRGQLVGGASWRDEDIDTAGTSTARPVGGDRSAVFAQLDFALGAALELVVAGRWDESSLHDGRFSPKLGLVWAASPSHGLRLTYNRAFQSPNYSELFLQAPTAIRTAAGPITALDLGRLEAALCRPYGVACGFANAVPVLVLGNESLAVETIETWEVGYRGVLANRAFVTVDYYRSALEDFVTDLLPNPFGTVNPAFGPYRPPPGHPAPALLLAQLQAALGPLFAFLSQNADGAAVFALASYTNAGRADTQGVELGLDWAITDAWTLDAAYSWFDFTLDDLALGDKVEPNAPEHQASLGLAFHRGRWDASLSYRWTEGFPWAAGVLVGTVPAYDHVALTASYQIDHRWSVGLNVSNLLDHPHYQTFGGDVLRRRALLNVAYRWPGE
jgi:outer membrane receptor protein involved in Fe transport